MLYDKGRKFAHYRWNPLGAVGSISKNVANPFELGQHDQKVTPLQKEQLENSNCKRLLSRAAGAPGNDLRDSFARENHLYSELSNKGGGK